MGHISVKNGFWPHVKKCFVVYIHVPGCLYMIWGHYIIGNGTSDLSRALSNVLEPYEHPNAKNSKSNYFARKKRLILANFRHILYTKNVFFKNLVLKCFYGSNTLDKVTKRFKVPFPMI